MAITLLFEAIAAGNAPPRLWLPPLKSNPLFPLRPIPPPRPLTIAPKLSDDDTNPLRRPAAGAAILEALSSLQRPTETAALLALLMAAFPYASLAASGGRMGGSNFSSYSSSSRSSSSSSASSSRSSSSYSNSSYSSPSSSTTISNTNYTYSVLQEPPRPMTAGDKVFLYCWGAFVVTAIVWSVVGGNREAAGPGITIHRIQVGLAGTARRLQKDLDHIAETADTSTSEGLHHMLTETALALLRDLDSCIYAYSSVDVRKTREDGEKEFGRLSIEERGKFDEETLVNSYNIKMRKTSSRGPKGVKNDYIVVTILLAAVGKHKLPAMNEMSDLKEALQSLGSIPPSETLAVEVLWTPQKESDTLSEEELLKDYPLLRPL